MTGAVFSFMDGTIHPYYTVALAPAIAALVGISVRELWRARQFLVPRIVLATMSAVTGVWAFILLDRTPDWWPALRWIVLAGSIVVAAMLVVGAHRLGRATAVLAAGAMLFGVAGRAAYTVETVANRHGGPMAVGGPEPWRRPRLARAAAVRAALQRTIRRSSISSKARTSAGRQPPSAR